MKQYSSLILISLLLLSLALGCGNTFNKKIKKKSNIVGATVDDRVGTMSLSASKFDSWGTVHKALEYWAKQTRFRLCKGRGEDNCIHPEN